VGCAASPSGVLLVRATSSALSAGGGADGVSGSLYFFTSVISKVVNVLYLERGNKKRKKGNMETEYV